jgi:hypothetical protein
VFFQLLAGIIQIAHRPVQKKEPFFLMMEKSGELWQVFFPDRIKDPDCRRVFIDRRPVLNAAGNVSGKPGKKPEDCKDLEDTKERHKEKPEFPRLVPENFHCGKCPERPEESAAQQGGFRDPPLPCRSPSLVSGIEKEYCPIHDEKEQYGEFRGKPAGIHKRFPLIP